MPRNAGFAEDSIALGYADIGDERMLALGIMSTLATVGGTVAGISAQRTATKRAKSQAEQAKRVRAEELTKIKAPAKAPAKGLVAQAKALPETAKKEAASIAAGRRRRRTTLATGPRGLLTEPGVIKPSLLGA